MWKSFLGNPVSLLCMWKSFLGSPVLLLCTWKSFLDNPVSLLCMWKSFLGNPVSLLCTWKSFLGNPDPCNWFMCSICIWTVQLIDDKEVIALNYICKTRLFLYGEYAFGTDHVFSAVDFFHFHFLLLHFLASCAFILNEVNGAVCHISIFFLNQWMLAASHLCLWFFSLLCMFHCVLLLLLLTIMLANRTDENSASGDFVKITEAVQPATEKSSAKGKTRWFWHSF